MDWNSKDLQSATGTPIATLLDILKNVGKFKTHLLSFLIIFILFGAVGSRCDLSFANTNSGGWLRVLYHDVSDALHQSQRAGAATEQ